MARLNLTEEMVLTASAAQALATLDCEFVAMMSYSQHAREDHVFVVAAKRSRDYGDDYVTWLYDATTGRFFWGHYDIPTESAAIDDMRSRTVGAKDADTTH